jgi:hypothetical protein
MALESVVAATLYALLPSAGGVAGIAAAGPQTDACNPRMSH